MPNTSTPGVLPLPPPPVPPLPSPLVPPPPPLELLLTDCSVELLELDAPPLELELMLAELAVACPPTLALATLSVPPAVALPVTEPTDVLALLEVTLVELVMPLPLD